MLKGFYITSLNVLDSSKAVLGVGKKILFQFAVLSCHFDMDWWIPKCGKENIMSKIVRRLPATRIGCKWELDERLCSADFLYIRKDYFDRSFRKFVKNVKKKSSKTKIIVEIPTYPYDKELKKILLWKEKMERKKLKAYIDKFVTLSKDDEIFGVSTIQIMNGIDVNSISPVVPKPHKANEPINIIAVAALAKWHGYDRLISGMGHYYRQGGKREIVFHLVGTGNVIPQYKKLVHQYGIQKNVVFHGEKYGEELEQIYNQCAIGVATLNAHILGIQCGSFLKSREYCAKGLPQFFAGEIDMFQDVEFDYVCKFPPDDQPIDMQRFIRFYDEIYIANGKNQDDIVREIREFAYHRCDMSKTMQPVIQYLETHV